MWIDLFLITCILVFGIDCTDFPSSVKKVISYIFTKGRIITDNYELRPFLCSLCATFWCGLIYLLVTGQMGIVGVAYVCLMAYSTRVLKDIFQLIEDILLTVIKKIESLL